MTHRDNSFKWIFPLQHMAQVKIVGILWGNSPAKLTSMENLLRCSPDWKIFCELMINDLTYSVQKLLVPPVLKNELNAVVTKMVSNAIDWLRKTSQTPNTYYTQTEAYAKTLVHFIENVTWDDNGSVDGRKILESYVRDKETIGYNNWKLLCDYCMKDDIEKFSETIYWQNCMNFTNSPHSIYWYRKIHGEFPTKQMFLSHEEYSSFERSRANGLYNEDNIVYNLLEKSAKIPNFPGGVSAIKYFREELNDEEKFQNFLSEVSCSYASYETKFYLLGEVKNAGLRSDSRIVTSLGDCFLQWPWILLVDNWMEVFEPTKSLPCRSSHGSLFREMAETMASKLMTPGENIFHGFSVELSNELGTFFVKRCEVNGRSAPENFLEIYGRCKIALEHITTDMMMDLIECVRSRTFANRQNDLGLQTVRLFFAWLKINFLIRN